MEMRLYCEVKEIHFSWHAQLLRLHLAAAVAPSGSLLSRLKFGYRYLYSRFQRREVAFDHSPKADYIDRGILVSQSIPKPRMSRQGTAGQRETAKSPSFTAASLMMSSAC